jgi:hypothetical protein
MMWQGRSTAAIRAHRRLASLYRAQLELLALAEEPRSWHRRAAEAVRGIAATLRHELRR